MLLEQEEICCRNIQWPYGIAPCISGMYQWSDVESINLANILKLAHICKDLQCCKCRVNQKSQCTCHRQGLYSENTCISMQIHLLYVSYNKCWKRLQPACRRPCTYVMSVADARDHSVGGLFLMKSVRTSFSSRSVWELSLYSAPFICLPRIIKEGGGGRELTMVTKYHIML
jgi:hypothetical protein